MKRKQGRGSASSKDPQREARPDQGRWAPVSADQSGRHWLWVQRSSRGSRGGRTRGHKGDAAELFGLPARWLELGAGGRAVGSAWTKSRSRGRAKSSRLPGPPRRGEGSRKTSPSHVHLAPFLGPSAPLPTLSCRGSEQKALRAGTQPTMQPPGGDALPGSPPHEQ